MHCEICLVAACVYEGSVCWLSCTHQVEGAFTQGLGLVTLEQCVYLEGDQHTQRGMTITIGPGSYKIPTVNDVPVELNVSLLDRTPNPKAIFSSKVSLKELTLRIIKIYTLNFVYLYSRYTIQSRSLKICM